MSFFESLDMMLRILIPIISRNTINFIIHKYLTNMLFRFLSLYTYVSKNLSTSLRKKAIPPRQSQDRPKFFGIVVPKNLGREFPSESLDCDAAAWRRGIKQARERAALTPHLILGGIKHESDHQNVQKRWNAGENDQCN